MRRRRKPFGLDTLLVLLAGIALGLAYSWLVAPVQYVDAEPSQLRDDFKAVYRTVIAASYASSGDLARARARLALLADPDPAQALNAQAQQMLAAGEAIEHVQQVAQLGADVFATPVTSLVLPAATGLLSASPTSPPSPSSTAAAASHTPAALATPTPRPTFTATALAEGGFVLTEQEAVCEKAQTEPLLEIIVMDSRRRQLPGAELIVTWVGGEDHFFTGFQTERGNGYADFRMQPDVVYAVRVGAGGVPVSNLSAPPCSASDGSTFPGGLKISFAQQ